MGEDDAPMPSAIRASNSWRLGPLALALALLCPAPAAAQWYVATYTGGNVTVPATVIIDQPAYGRHLEFEDVRFAARPLESPQYYGARIGRLFGARRRFGFELEFLHVKAIGLTDRDVRVRGIDGGAAIDGTMRMDAIVQRHAMSHGLNFWLANVVWRRPFGGAAGARPSLVLRAGAGPVVPGVDSVVGHVPVEGYQYAGLGAHLAAGIDLRLTGRLSAVIEYKFTAARPVLDIDRGTGRMTALTHHVAAGVGFGFSR
jgi:hypothetical protein